MLPAAGRLLDWVRLATPTLVGVLATVPVSRPTAADLPTERASGYATRKEPLPSCAADGELESIVPVETWATLFNVHTGEAFPLSSEEPSIDRFCDALVDRATGSRMDLDPRLLELLRQIAIRNPGARIELVSGYRSPKLNEMLRKKGH